MKSGQCPKCGSTDIRSGEFLEEKEWNYMGNRIPVTIALRNTAAWLDNYVCVRCGYVESYIANPDRLREISERWPAAVSTTQHEPPEGVWPPPPAVPEA